MNVLAGLPFVVVAGGFLLPWLFLDGGDRYLGFLWSNPRIALMLVLNFAILSYWVARRLSQALLLRSTGAKLRATHEPP